MMFSKRLPTGRAPELIMHIPGQAGLESVANEVCACVPLTAHSPHSLSLFLW